MSDVEPAGDQETTDAAPLKEFWTFLKDFNSIYAQIGKLAIAAPLIDLVINLGPPWPSRVGVGFALVGAQLLVVMCSFVFWKQGKTRSDTIRYCLLGSAVCVALVFAFGYLPTYAKHVVKVTSDYIVVGEELQPPMKEFVAAAAKQDHEVWGPRRLAMNFIDNETDEMDIWTEESVQAARINLLRWWLLTGAVYSVAVSAFISLQYRRIGRRRKGRPGR